MSLLAEAWGQHGTSRCRFPSRSHCGNEKARPPGEVGLSRSTTLGLRRSAAGARADHEAVVGIFGNLPPQIFVGAVGLHGVDRLLEVGVLGRDLAPQFV